MQRAQRLVLACLLAMPGFGADLAGSYVTNDVADVPFGFASHWSQPWRAWLETRPARQVLAGIGMVMGTENPPLVATMLARHGVRIARFDISWSSFTYADEDVLRGNRAADFAAQLRACRDHGIRPIILLHANDGAPCPLLNVDVTVLDAAAAGASTLRLADTSWIVVGRSGYSAGSRCADPLITAVTGNLVTLSKPLATAIPAGATVQFTVLRYRPFDAIGTAAYEETMQGWLRYTRNVAGFAAATLGTVGGADLGFDLEIWNELSNNSAFLDINKYYPQGSPPALDNRAAVWNVTAGSSGIVHRMAAMMDANPALFAGVRVSDGFSNTEPWPASSVEPARITAVGAHPYPKTRSFPGDVDPDRKTMDALHVRHDAPHDAGASDVGWTPTYALRCPESGLLDVTGWGPFADMAPFPAMVNGRAHGRFARPGGEVGLWITECGINAPNWGVSDVATAQLLKSKAALRYWMTYLGRGAERVCWFKSLDGGDIGFSSLTADFAGYIATNTVYPADDSAYVSPMLAALGRTVAKLADGIDNSLGSTRSISVTGISDTHGHIQFSGNGSAAYPDLADLADRECLVITPIQINAGSFAIAYHVMTRDLTSPLGDEDFTVGLSGLAADHAAIEVYDPIGDCSVPLTVLDAGSDHLSIRLSATDHPRLLLLREGAGGGETGGGGGGGGSGTVITPPAGQGGGGGGGGCGRDSALLGLGILLIVGLRRRSR